MIPFDIETKIIMYSYSFIWFDIHKYIRIHFGILQRKRSLDWIIFKKLIKYYSINGKLNYNRKKTYQISM